MTLEVVFHRPIQSGIRWADIESLLLACGAEVEERAGSRVAIRLNAVVAIFHRPHTRRTVDKGTVDSLRWFLIQAGIGPSAS